MEKHGTEILTADILDFENACVVSCFNIKSAYTEMLVNLMSKALDTVITVKSVYEVNLDTSALADNIPNMLHNACLSDSGVDTATELSIKHTNGYGDVSGGLTVIIKVCMD